MTTLAQTYKPKLAHVAIINKRDEIIEKLMPRRCMVISVGLILAGLGIPILMMTQVLPGSLLLGFICLAVLATGGALALFHWGEI